MKHQDDSNGTELDLAVFYCNYFFLDIVMRYVTILDSDIGEANNAKR